jgi:hypothetical protein
MLKLNKKNKTGATMLAVLCMVSVSAMLTGCGAGGSGKNVKIDGVGGPNVSFIDNKFTLTATLANVDVDFGLRLPIPNMEQSYLEIGPDFQSNGLLISIGIDVRDLNKLVGDNVHLLDPTRLPGGRPLPGVVGGQMPGFAVEVPKLNHTAFYVRKDVFGVFIPVKLPWKETIGTFRFYDDNGNRIGNISLVGADSEGKNSGFLLLINISGQVAKIMASAK